MTKVLIQKNEYVFHKFSTKDIKIVLYFNVRVRREYIITHNIRKMSSYKIGNDKRVKEP
jgi:hypothetical protein